MWDKVILVIVSYLLGAFPLMYLMGRFHGVDLRQYEDMHLATWRHVGRLQGFIGVVFDIAKGIIAVFIARYALDVELGWVAVAGVLAVVGQMWPVFLKFDGERGNSTGGAMAGTLAPYAFFIGLVPVAIGWLIRTIPRFLQPNQTWNERFRFGGPPSLGLPLGMAIGFAVLPLAAWVMDYPREIIFAFVVLFVLIMLRRLTVGLSEDLHKPSWKNSMLINRILYDRSEI